MNRIAWLAGLAASVSLVAGCASTDYTMAPTADTAGVVSYDHGVATVASDGANTVVRVSPIGFTQHGRIRLGVAVFNKGSGPVNLGYENVSVTDATGATLHKLDYAEIVRMAKRRAAMAEVAIALAGAAAAYGDAYAAQSTTYGNVGGTTFQATTYDPALAAELSAQTGAETGAALSQVNASLGNVIAQANGTILQTTTVAPGREFGGEVIVDPPQGLAEAKGPVTLTVVVLIGGDTHTFKFAIQKPAG
jgi:hypothetical protein